MKKLVKFLLACILAVSVTFPFVETSSEAASSTITATVNIKSGVLNVREKPSDKSKKLGSLKKGSKVTVYVKNKNGWSTIKYKNKNIKAYVASKYLKFPTQYSKKELDYFMEVAFWPDDSGKDRVTKWKKDLVIHVQGIEGRPNAKELKDIKAVVKEINSLQNSIDVKLSAKNPNAWMTFVYSSNFGYYFEELRDTNYSWYSPFWADSSNNIYDARQLITIDNDRSETDRTFMIRKVLSHALGFNNQPKTYKDSIFYGEWNPVTKYSSLDKKVIKIMYDNRVKSGMTKDQFKKAMNY